MITVPILRVQVKLDMSTTTNHAVAPHELALLSIKHGGGNITVGEFIKTADIDPFKEYSRLERLHGVDKESKRRWLDVAFGRFEEGRFERTMKDGAKRYMPVVDDDDDEDEQPEELTPQQKAAKTRKANKAKKAEEAVNVENAVAA